MKVIAIKHGAKGVIEQYKLDNDQIIDAEQAVQMVERGEIEYCTLSTARNGKKSIRSLNDGDPTNNLDNLPTFE